MTDNRISPDVTTRSIGTDPGCEVRATVRARFGAWLWADRYDGMLAVGVPAPAGGAMAAHAARLTSRTERSALAQSLLRAVHEAHDRTHGLSARVPLHRDNIAGAVDLIDAIAQRLNSPTPVSVRGMARLRRVLADGGGPLYRHGRGDLGGRLGAALAAL